MKELILKWALKNALEHDGHTVAGFVMNKAIGEEPGLRKDMRKLAKEVSEVVEYVNLIPASEQKKELEKIWPEALEKRKEEKKELPELPEAEGRKVVLRLAPFPSGPLHIGNAMPYVINDEYAKRYKGKLLLVIDDTIGSEEKPIAPDAYAMIPEGLRWLGIDFDPKIVYKSDRLDLYYKHAEEMIRNGWVYVCTCDTDTLRKNRAEGRECACRSNTVGENSARWKRMFSAYKPGEAALRIKTDMKNPNPAFRDRVLFRISEREHPRAGKKYRVWPTLEFSWAIDDWLLGITHVIRGKDLMIETDMEKWIWHLLGVKHPVVIHTGLMKIAEVKLSKSKAGKEVASGEYTGWDDPRTWSLQSLRRRGIRAEAIRSFVLAPGLSQTDMVVPIDSLYAENRKLIDAASERYMGVLEPAELVVENSPGVVAELKIHPDKTETKRYVLPRGTNRFHVEKADLDSLKKGDIVRLKDLYNVKITGRGTGEFTPGRGQELQKIHWVPADGALGLEMLMPDGVKKKGYAESTCSKLKTGDVVQWERVGFARVERVEKGAISCVFGHR